MDMAADGPSSLRTGAEQSKVFRERARKARAIAGRYCGEAANVLMEIAEDFDARAASLEAQAG